MKKILLLLVILACNGCFFDQKDTLECTKEENIGDIKIVNEYKFIYKNDKIDSILINLSFDCKKDNGRKVYKAYIERYNEVGGLNIDTNDKECIISIESDLKKQKSKVLNELNLSFLEKTNFIELKKNLKQTDYQC